MRTYHLFTFQDDGPANSKAILSFSGDGDDAVDLFAEASKAVAEADANGGGAQDEEEDEDGEEPEDDFNAAWEVLDLARAIYEKQKDEDEEVMLKLADTYITLGDISLETGAYFRLALLSALLRSQFSSLIVSPGCKYDVLNPLLSTQKNSTKESQTTPPASPSNHLYFPSLLVKSPKRTINSLWSSTSPQAVSLTPLCTPKRHSSP